MRHIPAIALLIGASACATGPYSDFAKAGRTYATAVDTLLDKAADERVDLSSEQLLEARLTAKIPPEAIAQKAEDDRAYLEQIERLKKHATALGSYFDALAELAGSSAPDDASKAAGDAFEALQKAGVSVSDSFKTPIEKVTQLAVSGIRSARLRHELQVHANTVGDEIALHQKVIAALKNDLEADERKINRDETRILADQIEKGIPAYPQGWVAARRALLRRPATIAELDAASDAAAKMKEAFDKLVTGELSAGVMQRIAHEIELRIKGGAA